MTDTTLAELAALQSMKTPELIAKWGKLNDSKPLPYNRLFLVSRLSYRIQELAYGGLKPATVRELEALGNSLDGGKAAKRKIRADRRPVTGTKLQRRWKDQTYEVTVRATDFEWEGRPYKHLSPISKAITGTICNGYVFFGLKKPGKSA
jgi:hypothetical protein